MFTDCFLCSRFYTEPFIFVVLFELDTLTIPILLTKKNKAWRF